MQLLIRKKTDIPSLITYSDEKEESRSARTPSPMENEFLEAEEAPEAPTFLKAMQHQQGIDSEGGDNQAVAVVKTVDDRAEKQGKSFRYFKRGRLSRMGRTSMKISKKAIALPLKSSKKKAIALPPKSSKKKDITPPLKRSKKKVSTPLLQQSTPPKTADAVKEERKAEISSPKIDSRSLIVPESSNVDIVQEEITSPASSDAASAAPTVATSVATSMATSMATLTDTKETGEETNEAQIDATGELGIETEEEVAAVPATEEEALPVEEEAALSEKEGEVAASAIEDAGRVEESAPAKEEVTSPVEEEVAPPAEEEVAPPAEEEEVASPMKEAVARVEESAPAKEGVSSSAEEEVPSPVEEVAAPIEEEAAADPMEEVSPAEEVTSPPAEDNLEKASLEEEAPPSEVETPSEGKTKRSETDTCLATLSHKEEYPFDNSINFEPSIETVEQDDAILIGFFPPEAPAEEPKDLDAFDFDFSKIHMMIDDAVVQTKELSAQGMGMLNCYVNDVEEQDTNNDPVADSSSDSNDWVPDKLHDFIHQTSKNAETLQRSLYDTTTQLKKQTSSYFSGGDAPTNVNIGTDSTTGHAAPMEDSRNDCADGVHTPALIEEEVRQEITVS